MTQSLIEAIHAAPLKLSLCICGAGASAVSMLTSVAGCSRTLIHAEVPYAQQASAHVLNYRPRQSVSAVVAQQLAQHAYHTCLLQQQQQQQQPSQFAPSAPVGLRAGAPILVGVGATSAIRTDRVRRGRDQAFVCVWGDGARHGATQYHLELAPQCTRDEQEREVTALILHAIAQAAATAATTVADDATQDQAVSVAARDVLQQAVRGAAFRGSLTCTSTRLPPFEHSVTELIQCVLDNVVPAVVWNVYGEARTALAPYGIEEEDLSRLYTCHGPGGHTAESEGDNASATTSLAVAPYDGRGRPDEAALGREAAARQDCDGQADGIVRLLYPGSYRPLHWGHTELARAAAQAMRRRTRCAIVHTTYEIAARIVDKGALSADEIEGRVRQFLDRNERIAVTQATLFVEKAALFPGHGFVIGVDTARRVLDPKYYGAGGVMHALLTDIASRGCYFVVGGRLRVAADDGAQGVWDDPCRLVIPAELQHLFVPLSELEFRVDISSTELRARRAAYAEQQQQ